MPSIPFIGGAYEGQSPVISAQEAVNCYLELGDGTLSQVGSPGTDLAVDLTEPIRGLKTAWGRLYAVSGPTVYEVHQDHSTTNLGSVTAASDTACMANNIHELLITSGGNGFTVQKGSNALAPITDLDFPDTMQCAFLDGYGLLLERNSGRFWWTTIDDFETISGTDFATSEGIPDDNVSMIVDHREIWLFNEFSTEVRYNDGSSPFARSPGGFIERGCKGVDSPAKLDNTVFWLAENGTVYRADGFRPQRISNHGIEKVISGTTTDPIGTAYTWFGHEFYQLTFPGEATIVYDASIPDPNKAWHTLRNLNRNDSVWRYTASAYGNQYVGGADGKIYKLNNDTFSHAGEDLPFVRAFGPIRTNGWTTMSELTFKFATGENSDPLNAAEVFLEISDDAGRTFGNRLQHSIGTQGQYTTDVTFHALGGFYDNERVYRVSCTDAARRVLVDVQAEFA